MNAFEQAFANAGKGSINIEEMEAEALGISVELMNEFKTGFKETYEIAEVSTIEGSYSIV